MGAIVGLNSEEDLNEGIGSSKPSAQVHVNERADRERILKTQQAMSSVLETLSNQSRNPNAANSEAAERARRLISEAVVLESGSGVNPAWEAVKLGLGVEDAQNQKIQNAIVKIEQSQKEISLLLDLSKELKKYNGKELSETAKKILNELKQNGIDLLQDEKTRFTKDEVKNLESLIGPQIEQRKSGIHIGFTTKIQPLLQNIATIMEILKNILRNQERLIDKANRLPGH